MYFNINDYEGKYAMHCKTEKEARDFCNYLHKHGRRWCAGNSYENTISWDTYKHKTAYNFNEGSYADVSFYKDIGYKVLEWSDFMNGTFTKADLKTGDVILRRNGWVEIVNRELDTCITKEGWNDLDTTKKDLTDGDNKEFDIIAVRRPIKKSQCQFDAFKYKLGTLIYDRERDTVEEMTLAEVCKLLGKNIKIIK